MSVLGGAALPGSWSLQAGQCLHRPECLADTLLWPAVPLLPKQGCLLLPLLPGSSLKDTLNLLSLFLVPGQDSFGLVCRIRRVWKVPFEKFANT